MKIKEDYISIISNAAMMGAAALIKSMKPQEDLISQRKAFADFGRGFIIEQTKRGNLTVVQKSVNAKNSRLFYSVKEITDLIASRNIERCIINLETSR